MNNVQEWNNIKTQLNNMTKQYPAKTRSNINDIFFKKSTEIMNEQSLSLIYDKYGSQIYEKTSDVQNYIKMSKSGFLTNLIIDDSKLIETKTRLDEYNTDFINYGSFENVEKEDVKSNMYVRTDFNEKNDYLYKIQEQKNRKEQSVKDGIDKIKLWFNTLGQSEIIKKEPTLKDNLILLR